MSAHGACNRDGNRERERERERERQRERERKRERQKERETAIDRSCNHPVSGEVFEQAQTCDPSPNLQTSPCL